MSDLSVVVIATIVSHVIVVGSSLLFVRGALAILVGDRRAAAPGKPPKQTIGYTVDPPDAPKAQPTC